MSYIRISKDAQNLIRATRLQKPMTMSQLAEAAGISLNTLKQIERGHDRQDLAIAPQLQEGPLLQVCAALGLPASTLEAGRLHSFRRTRPEARIAVFVASPMSVVTVRYDEMRRDLLMVVTAVRAVVQPGIVFSALEDRTSHDTFEDEAVALVGNLDRLKRADRLLAVFPEPSVTSVLVEIGIGLALSIPTIVFVKDRQHLPWMLRGHSPGDPPYRVVRYRDTEGLIALVEYERDWLNSTKR